MTELGSHAGQVMSDVLGPRFMRPWRWLLARPLFLLGLTLVFAISFVAMIAPLISPYDPIKINLASRLQPPNPSHLLGTDHLGRDLLSRLLYGTRVSLMVGVTIAGMSCILGSILGLTSGYFGRTVDNVIMRVCDMFFAFPPLILAMAIAASLGPSLQNTMLALVIVWWPRYARLARSQVLSLRELDYVQAAKAAGASHVRIMLRHILPNVFSPVVIQTTLDIGQAILMAASLGFLGFGAQPPTPEWGLMASEGRVYMRDFWWYPTFPSLMILITVLGFNLLGDGLRDALDPRQRGRLAGLG
ncbi:MAG: ABC transporter permease [Candidatus Hadarchaeum sp.]|uniref:nickel transporter permease n=1 Tax=Candidatus Hadarchaeum sp. TaxID=2883567 RepID=UPI003171537D